MKTTQDKTARYMIIAYKIKESEIGISYLVYWPQDIIGHNLNSPYKCQMPWSIRNRKSWYGSRCLFFPTPKNIESIADSF